MTPSSPSAPQSPFTPLTTEEELRLWPLAVHAAHLLENMCYVDYRQAEADAALLARELQKYYSTAELSRISFIGLPRGGLIVLGLLAYQLGLRPEQLQAAAPLAADVVCLVDDCALSGLRLQQALSGMDEGRVTVALLYAAPGLRATVQERYPFVEHCLAAHDLAEKPLSGTPIGEERQWDALLDGRLFTGPQETVAFAWNEPDLLVLTPFDDRPAHQWRFLPPHKCLKNRQALGLPPGTSSDDQLIVPNGIVYGWFDGILYLLDTGRQEVFRLDGFPADCWRSAAGYGSAEATLDFLHSRYTDQTREALNKQMESTLLLFEARGLLRSRPGKTGRRK